MESGLLQYSVLYFGDQNIHARAGRFVDQKAFEELSVNLFGAFRSSDLGAVIRAMDRGFRFEVSLRSLFKDAQRKIASQILAPAIEEAAVAYQRLYRHHAPLLRMMHELRIPHPAALRDAAAHALNGMLNEAFQTAPLDTELIRKLLDEATMAGAQLDATVLELTFRKTINQLAGLFFGEIEKTATLEELAEAVTLSRALPFPVALWSLQNRCYQLSEAEFAKLKERASHDASAAAWLDAFRRLSEGLKLA